MANPTVLDVDQLREVIPDLLEDLAGLMYGAIVMCLHNHSCEFKVLCEVKDLEKTLHETAIVWTREMSNEIEDTFGSPSNAAELAGEGIACLTIRAFTKYKVVRRAIRGEGVDFWLAERQDTDSYPFQFAARMESKGITEARYLSDILTQVNKGIKQSRRSDCTRLPAYIIVTEFGEPVIYMVQR